METFDSTIDLITTASEIKEDDLKGAYFLHGSHNSLDEDRLYLFPKMPDHKTCVSFINSAPPHEDRNIIIIRNGVVADCFKGSPDETNNALLSTYSLHQQQFPLPITTAVPRIVPVKIAACTRGILVKVRREDLFRDEVVKALNSFHLDDRIKGFSKIDFTKTNLSTDDYKYIAFQLGQTLALINGDELYTKQAISDHFPILSPFLQRKSDLILKNLEILNQFRDDIVKKMSDVKITCKGELSLLSVKNTSDWHLLNYQSRGLVVDVKSERVVCYPFNHEEVSTKVRDSLVELEWIFEEKNNHFTAEMVPPFIATFMHNNKLVVVSDDGFDTEAAKTAQSISKRYSNELKKMKTEVYDYIFIIVERQNNKKDFCLVGARDKITFRLASKETVVDLANSLPVISLNR